MEASKRIRVGRTTVAGELDQAGTAKLTRVDSTDTTYLVSPDTAARRYFGCTTISSTTIGRISKINNRRWSVTAYIDRSHLTEGTAPVTRLPDARTQAAAVRGLLRFYHHRDRGDIAGEPTAMSSAAQQYLMS